MQWDISWNISIVWDISNILCAHMRDISKVCDFWPEISPVYEISHQISPICESPLEKLSSYIILLYSHMYIQIRINYID